MNEVADIIEESKDIQHERSPYDYELKKLKAKHRIMARMLLTGAAPIEIANTLEMTLQRVSAIIGSEMFKLYIKKLEQGLEDHAIDTVKLMQNMTPEMLVEIEKDFYTSNSKSLRLSIFDKISSKAGYGSTQKVQVGGLIEHDYSDRSKSELIQIVEQRLKKMKEAKVEDDRLLEDNVQEAEVVDETR